MKVRVLFLCCAAAGLLAVSGCGRRAERLAEIEKRLDYLTSELADQRAELERLREKVGATDDRKR